MTTLTPIPARQVTLPLPPLRLAERALAAADGNRYEALWAAVMVYQRLLDQAEEE